VVMLELRRSILYWARSGNAVTRAEDLGLMGGDKGLLGSVSRQAHGLPNLESGGISVSI
jgi:hypothetical protein